MTKVDLGAGLLDDNKIDRYTRYLGVDYKSPDYVKVDFHEINGIDKTCDLETEKLPFNDNSVDEIITIHTLEHIRNLGHLMRECHRILKPHGILKIWVPHCFSATAFGDSTHVRFFTFDTLAQFCEGNQASYYYDFHFKFITSKMQILRRWYKSRFWDKLLEKVINNNQRKGERFLKVLPYKEWEVYFELKKP